MVNQRHPETELLADAGLQNGPIRDGNRIQEVPIPPHPLGSQPVLGMEPPPDGSLDEMGMAEDDNPLVSVV